MCVSLSLSVYFTTDGLDEEEAANNKASVKLDIRKYVAVLNCYNIPNESIICCMWSNSHNLVGVVSAVLPCCFLLYFAGIIEAIAVIIHVQLSPMGVGSLTYYLPVLTTGVEDFLQEYSEEEDERDVEDSEDS